MEMEMRLKIGGPGTGAGHGSGALVRLGNGDEVGTEVELDPH